MISSFEYVTVLISIVLGLGITQLLTGVARLIQKQQRLIIYWPHLLWIIFILFLHVQEWWVMYELKTYIPWRLPVFLFVMLYPINLFVMAKLIFPDSLRGKTINLKEFYFDNFRKIFSMLVISAVLSLLYNLFILNLKITDQFLQLLLIASFGIIVIKKYTSEWVHKTVSLIVTLIMCASIIVEWNVWLIN
jgi:hypothetical protein